jgi:hypothetical protein
MRFALDSTNRMLPSGPAMIEPRPGSIHAPSGFASYATASGEQE